MTRPLVEPMNTSQDDDLPAVARPWVENLLNTYADLCDRRDVEGLGALLERATVRFGDAPPIAGRAAIASWYGDLFAGSGRTRHLLSNLVVTTVGPSRVTTRTAYTRWKLDPEPTLVGMGRYLSEFVRQGGHWTFTGHTVVRDWFLEQR